jgi:phosphoglycerate dehydrogenase-like enzyme
MILTSSADLNTRVTGRQTYTGPYSMNAVILDGFVINPVTFPGAGSAKNCIITSHNAWATKEARTRLLEIAASNIASFLDCSPQNVVA